MTVVTYEGLPEAIERLVDLMDYFSEKGFEIVLPGVSDSRVYGNGEGKRVIVTRTGEEFCSVAVTEKPASSQTWEAQYGYFFQTIRGSEIAIGTLARLHAYLGEVQLPTTVGGDSMVEIPSIGKIRLVRTGENSLRVSIPRK